MSHLSFYSKRLNNRRVQLGWLNKLKEIFKIVKMPQKCPFLKLKILPILSPKNGSFVDLIWRLLNPGRRQLWRRVLPMPFVERRRGRSRRPRKRKSCCVGSVKFRFQVVNRILSPAVAAVETSAQSFKSFVRNDVVVVVVVCRRRPKT